MPHFYILHRLQLKRDLFNIDRYLLQPGSSPPVCLIVCMSLCNFLACLLSFVCLLIVSLSLSQFFFLSLFVCPC